MHRKIIIFAVSPICCFFLFCGGNLQNIEKLPDNKSVEISKSIEGQNAKTLKRKVAIARFTNETKYGKTSFFDDNSGEGGKVDMVEKQAMDILSAKLASTEKFILLEREDLELIGKELEIANLEALNVAADYLIVGSVSEFGRKTTGKTGVFSRSKRQTAYARVNIRLIDVYTGQIIYSEEGEGEAFSEAGTVMGIGGRAGYDGTLNDKAIATAISNLVGKIVENLMDKPWRSFILDYEDNNYIISGGKSQGLKTGDVFAVHKKGKMVKNPQTGMMIELPGKEVGKIKVIKLLGDTPSNEAAICVKESGELPTEHFTDYFVQQIQ